MSAILIIKCIPLIISTAFKHFIYGPPQPSWDLKVHLRAKLLHYIMQRPTKIEEVQIGSQRNDSMPPSDIKIDEILIPHEYRTNAQAYIERLIKPYEIAIDPIWKSPKDNGINGDLIMSKDWNGENNWAREKIVLYSHGGAYCVGSTKTVQKLCCELSKSSGARILSINYRLAPQHPFPAALCDALATYLYLTNPPNDSGFKPYKPEQIVLCGDSAGGGLSISLGLALRDSGLPLPAGIVGWSPFVDLTSSMPSFFDPIIDKSDYLPSVRGALLATDPDSNVFREFRSRTEKIARNIQQHPEIKLIGDDSLKRIGQQSIGYYIVNEGYGIPYVSPMLAESLGGLPPMLIVAGNVERLRDEAIYLSYRAANPEKYRLPKYEVDFDNSCFKSPTKVILELYDEMFHAFQYHDSIEPTEVSFRRTGEFISNVVQEAAQTNSSHSFNAYKITYNGEVQDLDESSIENVLNWDKAGVFPGV